MSGNSSGMPSQSNILKPNSTSETKSQYPLSRPTCNYGKKPGHLVSDCLKLKRKLESDEAKPTGLTTLRPRPQSSIKTNTIDIVTKPTKKKEKLLLVSISLFLFGIFVSPVCCMLKKKLSADAQKGAQGKYPHERRRDESFH